jgi:tetratricopeptide (TPR) repeat protein
MEPRPGHAYPSAAMKSLVLCAAVAACAKSASAPDAGVSASDAYLGGQQKLQARDMAGAEQLFQKATALDPKMVQAHHALADVFYQEGKYHEASDEYSRAVAIDAKKQVSWLGLAKAYAATGRTEDAFDAASKALALDQKNPAALRQVASLQAAMNHDADAVAGFLRAAEIDPGGSAADFQRAADIRQHAGDMRATLDLLAKAAAAAPEDGAIWTRLGELQVKTGDLTRAVESFSKAVTLSPHDPTLPQLLGELYLRLEQPEEAKKQFQRAIEIKDFAAPHLGIARALLAAHDREGAREELKKAADLPVADELGETRDTAAVSAAIGEHENAVRIYEALTKIPEVAKDVSLWVDLARSEKALKRNNLAKIACDRAHAIDPKRACP